MLQLSEIIAMVPRVKLNCSCREGRLKGRKGREREEKKMVRMPTYGKS